MDSAGPVSDPAHFDNLYKQIRSLGAHPVGTPEVDWQVQLQQARASCLEALRVWNDPINTFRTAAFSLLFVTAWNSIAIAVLQRDGSEWRKPGDAGHSLNTNDLASRAFPGAVYRGVRENLAFWVDLRNAVAHQHLPALDVTVIPWAQAGLLNTENVLTDIFGAEFALAERLSVPLQLPGFRDPGVLSSLRQLQAKLPLEVQAVLARADDAPAELLADSTYMLRVAFVPAVPASGRNPDAVAHFVRPDEVSAELRSALAEYVILPKSVPRAELLATEVVGMVQQQIGFRFNTNMHVNAARALGVRPPRGKPDNILDRQYGEYIAKLHRYLYTDAWVKRLVRELTTSERFEELTERPAVEIDKDLAAP